MAGIEHPNGQAIKPTLRGIVQNPMYFLAFGFGSGLSPFAPGTAGTAAAIPLFWIFLLGLTPVQYLLATAVVTVAGIYICQRTTDWLCVHDHGGIVWDEFAGFLIGMIPVVFLAAQNQSGLGLETAVGDWPLWLWIVVGFFVCGFQLAFITVHMPAFLSDRGFSAHTAVVSLSLIGLFNIFGCLLSGSWSGKYSKKNLLTIIYALRAIAIAAFMLFEMSEMSVYLFSIVTGLLWLATVPPTSGLVAQLFGLPYMGLLYGIVFLSHQLGSFSGVWLGGYLYDLTGSYDVVWWSACAIALVTALVHLFIDERPVPRLREQPLAV